MQYIYLTITSRKVGMNNLPVMKTPYQGLNAILGDGRGIRRGEFVVIAGRRHEYLHGLLIDLQIGQLVYNPPAMIDQTKNPMVISINLTTTHEAFKLALKSHIEKFSGLKSYMIRDTKYRYKTINFKNTPVYTVEALIEYVSKMESDGNEIHLLTIDDVSLLSNLDSNGNVLSTKEMISKLRHHFAPRGTTVITTLEFDEVVNELPKDSHLSNLENITIKGLYGGEHRISQEVDCELAVSLDGNLLNLFCGKHRGVMSKYNSVSYLLDDLSTADFLGADMSKDLKHIPFNYQGNSNAVIKSSEEQSEAMSRMTKDDNARKIYNGVRNVLTHEVTNKHLYKTEFVIINYLGRVGCTSFTMGVDSKLVVISIDKLSEVNIRIGKDVEFVLKDCNSLSEVLSKNTSYTIDELIDYATSMVIALAALCDLAHYKMNIFR